MTVYFVITPQTYPQWVDHIPGPLLSISAATATKEHVKYVPGIMAPPTTFFQCFFATLIVNLPLLLIRQCLVSLGYLLELR